MTVYAIRRENETNEKLIKRWKRQVNGARILSKIRGDRYHKKDATKRLIREAAQKRSFYQEKRVRDQFYA